jgi:hypothetical protein
MYDWRYSMMKQHSLLIFLVLAAGFSLSAQTHVSVPLDNTIYYVLEQAQMRGLCGPLPAVKPYSQAAVRAAIDTILASDDDRRFGKLTPFEREVLEGVRKSYEKPAEGLALSRGAYYFENTLGQNDTRISVGTGFKLDMFFSEGMGITESTFDWGFDLWPMAYFNGDMGEHFSFGVNIYGGILRSPREAVGTYNTYYENYKYITKHPEDSGKPTNNVNEEITAYSQPLAFFPYSYEKRWDGFVWNYKKISNSGQLAWPDGICIGYSMLPELGGSFLDGHFTYRMGRIRREWGAMSGGSSLVYNQAAQPFLALELTVSPFSWFNFSTLTGVLEYYNAGGIKDSAATSQNAYSIGMVELNYKNYVHVDFGSTVIWAKRFELGYLFPLVDNFLYQNNIGDFDNMAYFFNMKGQYPGIANAWLSFFLDEINPEKAIFELDRGMYAYQGGTTVYLPWLPFASVKLSYTKIEPYCYTHTKEYLPWYGFDPDGSPLAMETSYVNNGESIGSYLPPNSDELLLRFETMPGPQTNLSLQYQMIRHGADYGDRAVDGSSLRSELDPDGRSSNPILRKYFLKDGAYQWMHILKIGAEHSLAKKPVRLFGEFGVAISYFTDIEGAVNSGSPSSYSITDNPLYPKAARVIATVGIRIFP